MTVFVPSPLRSYTQNKAEVAAEGNTLQQVLLNLDRRYPGFRFRIINEQESIRTHIKLFVNLQQVNTLDVALRSTDTIHIICALSGG